MLIITQSRRSWHRRCLPFPFQNTFPFNLNILQVRPTFRWKRRVPHPKQSGENKTYLGKPVNEIKGDSPYLSSGIISHAGQVTNQNVYWKSRVTLEISVSHHPIRGRSADPYTVFTYGDVVFFLYEKVVLFSGPIPISVSIFPLDYSKNM